MALVYRQVLSTLPVRQRFLSAVQFGCSGDGHLQLQSRALINRTDVEHDQNARTTKLQM